MPAFYAHYQFGQKVKEILAPGERKLLTDNRALFELGLHGPDILFFYHPLRRHPITRIGVVLHHETGRTFFEHAVTQIHRSAAGDERLRQQMLAYAIGVVCHFALDASCHPYINLFEQEKKISHHEIEKELEKYLMREDGLDPFSWDFSQTVSAQVRWSRPIALFYGLESMEIHQAVKGFLYFSKLFFTTGRLRRRLIFAGMKLARVYGETRGFFANEADNPVCLESSRALKERLEGSISEAVLMIGELEAVMCGQGTLSELFDRTFSG